MIIDPFQIATSGVGPGYTTYSFATLGFSIEVVPVPPGYVYPPSEGTGSGNIAGYVPYNTREKIKIVVKRDGKEWEEEFYEIDTPAFLKDSEGVNVTYVKKHEVEVKASFVKYMINKSNVIIKVTKL